MGQFFNITCPKCGQKEAYDLGIGFIPLEDSVYEEILEKPEYESLRTKIKSPIEISNACYKIYYCKDCKTLENHISFRLPNIPSFRFRRKCSKCGKIMKVIEDAEKLFKKEIILNCNKCGAEDIFDPKNTLIGFWD